MSSNKISNYDIMDNDLDCLFNGDYADCMYSDPPWGEANLKYWRTMNSQTGYPVNWPSFIERIKVLYEKHVRGPLFLETGKRFVTDLTNVFGRPDISYVCVYGAKKLENVLMCFGDIPHIDLSGKSSVDLVYSCLSSLRKTPSIVFDPCVGLGNTIKASKKLGASVRCNELNYSRMIRSFTLLDFDLVED